MHFQKILDGIRNNEPDLLREMHVTGIEVRRFLRKHGLQKDPNLLTSDVPIVRVDGPIVSDAVRLVGRKLFLALYYRHTGKILPHSGRISVRWFSNIQLADGIIPPKVYEILNSRPQLIRCNTNLEDQFFYRYAVAKDGTFGAFLVYFRSSFAVLGVVGVREDLLPERVRSESLSPFPTPDDQAL